MNIKSEHTIHTIQKIRNRYWLKNVVISHVVRLTSRRNPKIWIFGAWEGNKYDDNSKYLFEYVSNTCKDIEAIWLSNNPDVVDEVKKLGYKSELSSSINGVNIQKKAGVVFYTNGVDDFGKVCYFYGALIVSLWHGISFKKVYYNTINYSGLKYFLKRIKDILFSYVQRDVTVSSSIFASYIYETSFKINRNRIYITGFPRYDALKRIAYKRNVLLGREGADEFRYILYMPTHRPYEDLTIERTVEELSRDKRFTEFLHENRVKLLLKLHYLTNIKNEDLSEDITVLKDNDITSVQDLLVISEVLLTDYSSAAIDFAVLNKPICFFTPDYEKYCNTIGIMDPGEEIYRTHSKKSVQDLIYGLEKAILYPKEEMALTERLNELFLDSKMKNRCYSKEVFDLIRNLQQM